MNDVLKTILDKLETLAKQGTINVMNCDDHIETLEYGKLEELRLNNYSAKLLLDYIQQRENIIKEVREYIMTKLITEWDIKNDGYVSGSDLPVDAITPILEILDKEENNEYINK